MRLDAPFPTPSYAAGVPSHGAYEQPLADISSAGQWSYPTTSMDKGKARAMDQSTFYPVSTGNEGK